MKNKIENIKQLRENLISELELFNDSQKDESNINRLSLISKTSSAIIRSAKTELEYAKYKGLNTEITFLK